MVRIIKNYTNLFSVITSIFLIYLGLVFSSCGAGCDCNKTNLQIKYNSLNFVSGLPSCGCSLNNFYSIPNHWDLTVKNKWGTGGGFYYLPHNEIGVKNITDRDCGLTESFTEYKVTRKGRCIDRDGSQGQANIFCFDSFRVGPLKCGESRIIDRGDNLTCVCQ